jgi:hypothetical protein
MDYHEVVDELESAERELGLAACDPDESESGPGGGPVPGQVSSRSRWEQASDSLPYRAIT